MVMNWVGLGQDLGLADLRSG